MNFGFLVDQDRTRYCWLRLRRLKAALKDSEIIDALARELEVPGGRMAAIERRIQELRNTKSSLWYEVPAPEVLAASIFKARQLSGGRIEDLFAQVRLVRDLGAPLASWLKLAALTPYPGAVPGIGRANLVGYRGGHLMSSGRIIGIEATNDATELDRALDQMKTAREHTHASYIACTPALAAEFLWAQATAPGSSRWDADALRRRLQECGCGLLLVEGDAVTQAIPPKERRPDKAMLAQLAVAIQSTTANPR